IQRQVVQLGRAFLDTASPAPRDRILRRRLRRARPSWLSPTDPDLVDRLEKRPLEAPTGPLLSGDGAYVRALRTPPQSPSLSMEPRQAPGWPRPAGVAGPVPLLHRDPVD